MSSSIPSAEVYEEEYKKWVDGETKINHFIAMRKQSEDRLDNPEMGDWMRGYYSGERAAYGHCIKYLQTRGLNE